MCLVGLGGCVCVCACGSKTEQLLLITRTVFVQVQLKVHVIPQSQNSIIINSIILYNYTSISLLLFQWVIIIIIMHALYSMTDHDYYSGKAYKVLAVYTLALMD